MEIEQPVPEFKLNDGRRRQRNRRGNISFGFECEGHGYRAAAGYFDDGALAEIFLDVPGKAGTSVQSNANTAAILTSLLLQHAVAPETIRGSVSGPIAVALHMVAEMERTP